MGNSNYAQDVIPDANEMIAAAKENAAKLQTAVRYSFNDLFLQKKNKNGDIEFSRNLDVWSAFYNNYSNSQDELDEGVPLRKKSEVKGIYVLFDENGIPVYTGISRKIISRLKNHFLGKTHFQATLVYLMCRQEYEEREPEIYSGERKELIDFINRREYFQQRLRNYWSISILPIVDNYELYFTEIYLACELKTKWNSFETH